MLIDIGAKGPADDGNVADDGCFILYLLHVLAHQPADDNRLAVPHTDVRGHLARAENGLVDHILGEQNCRHC